jgi:hypothetical protein
MKSNFKTIYLAHTMVKDKWVNKCLNLWLAMARLNPHKVFRLKNKNTNAMKQSP